jgi:hypothetical protein
MLGRKSEFEKALARKIDPDRAAAIARELGKEILSNPLMKQSANETAEVVATIARFKPNATPHEIAAEFVDGLSKQFEGR